MTTRFAVRTTSAFDRSLRKLSSRHSELADVYAEVQTILATDPYNRSGAHSIKKLVWMSALVTGSTAFVPAGFVFVTTSKVRSSTSNSVRYAVRAPIADSGLSTNQEAQKPRGAHAITHSFRDNVRSADAQRVSSEIDSIGAEIQAAAKADDELKVGVGD